MGFGLTRGSKSAGTPKEVNAASVAWAKRESGKIGLVILVDAEIGIHLGSLGTLGKAPSMSTTKTLSTCSV